MMQPETEPQAEKAKQHGVWGPKLFGYLSSLSFVSLHFMVLADTVQNIFFWTVLVKKKQTQN